MIWSGKRRHSKNDLEHEYRGPHSFATKFTTDEQVYVGKYSVPISEKW